VATKLDLLLSFNTGQGVAGGKANYLNYPIDHDTNYGLIQVTTNQMIDELTAARLQDAAIPRDILVSSDVEANNTGNGRFSPNDVTVTYSGATLTISAGDMFLSGQKVTTAGDTFSAVRADDLYFIASDVNGLLTISTFAVQAFGDIASVTVSSNLWTTPDTDLLATDDQLTPLLTGDTINRIYERTDMVGVQVGNDAPAIRCVGADGTLEDAGFTHAGSASRFQRVARKATSEGSGAAVVAEIYTELGQNQQLEQARCIATATAEAAGTSSALAALNFDAAVRREPAGYFTDPWFDGNEATFTQPGGTTGERANFIGTYAFSGYVEFPDAVSVGPFIVDVVADGVTVFNARVAKVASGVTTVPISGFFELADDAANTIQVRTAHNDAASLNVDARFGFVMIGGGV
jgi:hypothetical protein